MKYLLTTLAVSIILSSAFANKPSNNLLKDASFNVQVKQKRFFGKWIGINDKKYNYILDKKIFVTAPYSMRFGTSTKNTCVLQNIMLKANTTYRLSFYVKLKDVKATGKYPGASVNINDGKNNFFPKKRLMGTMDWTKQEFEFKTNNTVSKNCYIQLTFGYASGTVWYDDVVLEEVKP